MATRKARAIEQQVQAEIPAALLPLSITAAALTNPRTGKPTAACSQILADIARLVDFRAAQGKPTVTVTVTVTAAQRELLRDNHRDYPQLKCFSDSAVHKAAVAAFRERRLFYCGVELVTPA